MFEKRHILIVVDAQNDFITGSLGSKEAQNIVPKIVNKINNHNDLIIATADTHFDDEYHYTLEGAYLPIKHCIAYGKGWEIEESINKAVSRKDKDEYVFIIKHTFGSKEMIEYLNQSPYFVNTIGSFELVGYVLDICVVSNALLLKAFFPEVPITVDTTCCAATSQKAREATIEVLRSCQIDVIE